MAPFLRASCCCCYLMGSSLAWQSVPAHGLSVSRRQGSLRSRSFGATTPRAAASDTADENGRQLLFLSSLSGVSGPPFNHLVDQLVDQCGATQKRCAFVPTARFVPGEGISRPDQVAAAEEKAHELTSMFGIDDMLLLELDTADPSSLSARIKDFEPSLFWVQGGNTFFLRHHMRRSGFDDLARRRVAGDEATTSLYVGQSAGAICGAASVIPAFFKGWDDPTVAGDIDWVSPDQSPGLAFAGPDRSIFPHFDAALHTSLIEEKRDMLPSGHEILPLRDDQAWVWSQSFGVAKSFKFNQDGSLEDIKGPDPLPAL